MKDQYERAMKLHMSNKINEKNVYQLNLNLIDCIHQESFSIHLTFQVYIRGHNLIHFWEVFWVKVISLEIHFDPPTWNS